MKYGTKALKVGTIVEMKEHHLGWALSEKISADHLKKDPHAYDKEIKKWQKHH